MKRDECIQKAMELHKKGDIEEAKRAYHNMIDNKIYDKRVFVNLAAIYRQEDEPKKAAAIANKGISLVDPNSPILLNTLGNSLRDLKRYDEAINVYRTSIKNAPEYFDPKVSLVACLRDAGYENLADAALKAMIKFYGATEKPLLYQLINYEVELAANQHRNINPNLEVVLRHIDKSEESPERLPNHWFSLSQICITKNQVREAIDFYYKGIDQLKASGNSIEKSDRFKENAKQLYTVSSWNFGCQLLRQGEFNLGWKLYEHGLRTPADGLQRWQRALFKPFSFNKIRLWKGESIKNKRLLLLGEQGIGDSMMFFTLIPKLLEEGGELTLIVPQRLKEIYERSLESCEVIGAEDCKKEPPNHQRFDYQCPVGSIPQHRYKNIEDFFGRNFMIISDREKTSELRQKYLKESNSNTKIIGLSWQGGGTKDRVNDKSIKLKSLLNVLKPYDFKLISLQYGDDAKIVADHAAKQNVDFIDDPDIQATKDMNSWLNQVDSCDAVISIANTTIHGAGGLNKPTLCMLGTKADWRWLQDTSYSKSYWYPSVDIAWQDRDKSWDTALGMIVPWLRSVKLIA